MEDNIEEGETGERRNKSKFSFWTGSLIIIEEEMQGNVLPHYRHVHVSQCHVAPNGVGKVHA